ncbi:MAG: DUF2798 domain-containing protein [Rhodovulum sp.]|jgi:hypothetical protein|nr:hypothetical protein [Rhodovulum sp.]MCI5084972.1 DUF2798 domain-containing protein [Rhodovulum sp.]|tara:strand:+ start:827 stop:1060 length:234 start_codon:yes stop_codon:yes gene_type:complete
MQHNRIRRLTGSLVMSTFMSVSLSGLFTLLEFGATVQWLEVWGRSILIALPVAFTLDMLFGTGLRRMSDRLVDRALP